MPVRWNGNSLGKKVSVLMNFSFEFFHFVKWKALFPFQLIFHSELTFISNTYDKYFRSQKQTSWPCLILAQILRSQILIFCCNPEEEAFKNPHKFLQDGTSCFLPLPFHVASCLSKGLWDLQAEGASEGSWMCLPLLPPRCRAGASSPSPSILTELKQGKEPTGQTCSWICSQ